MKKKENINQKSPQIVLYEFNYMATSYFIREDDSFFKKLIKNTKMPYYKLEYFKEFEGKRDVIRYSRIGENSVVSYYTIKDNDCVLVADHESIVKNNIIWRPNFSIINFVVPRFKAFKDNGIIFENLNINYLIQEYDKSIRYKLKKLAITKNN